MYDVAPWDRWPALAIDDATAAAPAIHRPAPGKRTLTQRLPARRDRRDRGLAPVAALHQAAADGVAGAGAALPFHDQLSRAFGLDLSDVTAHVGGAAAEACDALGAEAYATGASVAFRAAPDLHTAAHEAAHVVQQRAGLDLPGGLGAAGDVHERHADAVADRVVAGASAVDLLAGYVDAGAGSTAAVQRKLDGDGAGGATWTLTITTDANTDLIIAARRRGPDAVVIALFAVAKAAVFNATTGVQEPMVASAGNGRDFLVVRGSDHQFLYRFTQPPRVDADTVATIMGDAAWGSGHGGLGQDQASGPLRDPFTSDWTEKIDDLLTVFGPLFAAGAPPQTTTTPVTSEGRGSYWVAVLDEHGRNLMQDPASHFYVVWDGEGELLTKLVDDESIDYWQLMPGKHALDDYFGFAVDLKDAQPLRRKRLDDKTAYQPWSSFTRPPQHEASDPDATR